MLTLHLIFFYLAKKNACICLKVSCLTTLNEARLYLTLHEAFHLDKGASQLLLSQNYMLT